VTRLRWYEEGSDPDHRFSLANERTFLAWIRTALALVAGAVAVLQFVPPFRVAGARVVVGLLLAAAGLAAAVVAYVRWRTTESAMRTGRPLPRPVSLLVAAVVVAVLAAVVLALAVVDAAVSTTDP
jgi:putative membrane protein